ncbi:hypothetical protein [Rhodococcus sovatensis]|uniref:Uncharacterized protein n=1 Tax=Rhodococcus sovatensis TaxID=1805840 RepID=A0ABZ2PQG1_9NOCA
MFGSRTAAGIYALAATAAGGALACETEINAMLGAQSDPAQADVRADLGVLSTAASR